MTKLPNGTRVRIISTIDRGKWNGMTGTVSESGKNVYDYRVIIDNDLSRNADGILLDDNEVVPIDSFAVGDVVKTPKGVGTITNKSARGGIAQGWDWMVRFRDKLDTFYTHEIEPVNNKELWI
jgi:hypothetical protein